MATVGSVGNFEDTIQVLLGGTKAVWTVEKIGSYVGVYLVAGVNGDIVPFKISGWLGQAPKNASTETWAVGNPVYWDATNSVFTTAPNGTSAVGFAASAAGSTAAVGDVVLVQNGSSAGDTFVLTADLLAASVDVDLFVADRACRVVAIREAHAVAGGASAAVRPRKITDTSAPGAVAGATVKELTTANIDLTAVANTVVSPALSATASDLVFAAGNRLALDFSGTLTALVGKLTIVMQYIN